MYNTNRLGHYLLRHCSPSDMNPQRNNSGYVTVNVIVMYNLCVHMHNHSATIKI